MNALNIIKITSPIIFSYIPLGVSFGVFSVSSGINWNYTVLISILVYAGSAEFLLVAFIISFASVLEVFIAIFLINLRHFFYGISILNDFKHLKGFSRVYSIYGLTDETFALLKLQNFNNTKKQVIYPFICFLNQSYWVFGVFLGAYFGQFLNFNQKGLTFILTSLFVVLAVELYNKLKLKGILFISIFISIFCLFLPSKLMLIINLTIFALFLIVYKNRINI